MMQQSTGRVKYEMDEEQDRASSIAGIVPGIEKFALMKHKPRSRSTCGVLMSPRKKKEPSRNDLFCTIEESPNYFFKLCDYGNVEKILDLLSDDPQLIYHRNSSNGYTGIHHAAGRARLNVIDILLSKGADINAQANNGNTPLHVAIEKNRLESVRHLMTLHASPSMLNNAGLAPFHLAVSLNRPLMLEEFLSYDRVDLEMAGRHGLRASHYACTLNDPACLKILMEHHCLLCQPCENGFYPLHTGVKSGAVMTVRYMLTHIKELRWNYTVEQVLGFADKERDTPLHLAVNSGDIEMVQVCLDFGARVDCVQENKSTALHFACAQGSLPIVRLLYEAHMAHMNEKARVEEKELKNLLEAKDCLDMTPLHRASIYDHFAVVEYLIAQKAPLNGKDRQLRTPLLLAVTRGGSQSANRLLDAGADINVEDIQKRNILHYLVLNASNGDLVPPLIERIVSDPKGRNLLNSKDTTGCTPLHVASRAGNVKFTETLLRLGATLRLKDNDEQSPLHFAARYARYNTVKRLLDSPAGPNIINEVDNSGATALHIASANGHSKIVQLLMCKGALIHKDNFHRSPLHRAVENGHPDTIRVLLTFHNNLLDSKCKSGGSPLHFAAVFNQPRCVEFLLSTKCDYVFNDELKTPLDLAIEKQNVEAAMAMIKHDRWEEILTSYDSSGNSPVFKLIKHMPEVYKVALDRSITQSSNEKPDWVKYSFKFVESEIYQDSTPNLSHPPLATLNAMVEFGRVELLSHPICLTFLKTKWLSYGFCFFFVTMLFYAIFVLCLTLSVLFWHDTVMYGSMGNFTGTSESRDVHSIYSIPTPLRFYNWCVFLYIFFYAVLNLVKEAAYIIHQPWVYFSDVIHYMKLILYVASVFFTIQIFACKSEILLNWQYGSIAVFFAWFNLVIYLQRLDGIGLYVVMFRQILSTVFKVILLFSGLFVAFGLTFYLLLWTEKEADFKTPIISVVQTVMCMMGEWNYVELFANPYFEGKMVHPTISFAFLILFVALMPILFINLLIGLAVGDIEMVQKDASLKRLAMQVEYHTELEKIMPKNMLEKWKRTEVIHSNLKTQISSGFRNKIIEIIRAFLTGSTKVSKIVKTESSRDKNAFKYRAEFEKTRRSLEMLNNKLDHLNDLIRLIVQKMEIGAEADYDFDQYTVLARP